MYVTQHTYIKEPSRQDRLLELLADEKPRLTAKRFLYGSAATITQKTDEVEWLNGVFSVEKAEEDVDALIHEASSLPGNRKSWYRHYEIEKRSGGKRPIDDPCQELRAYVGRLKRVLEQDFFAMYHNSAWAYVKYREPKKCIELHKGSRYFLKTDFHDFFGSTTMELMKRILPQLWPFNVFCADENRAQKLWTVLDPVFLNGKLPQGSPISPMLTNLVMIPFDTEFCALMKQHGCKYTRYADDCLISSDKPFKPGIKVQNIVETLKELGYPYALNGKKTRYGSSSGKNWNLGLMLNKEGRITIGHQAKREFKADLFRLYHDCDKAGALTTEWLLSLQGRYHYYYHIEPGSVSKMDVNAKSKARKWWWTFDRVIGRGLYRAHQWQISQQ